VYGELRYFSKAGFFGIIQARSISKIFADDANAVINEGYFTANIKVGYRKQLGKCSFEPFLGINNLTGTVYNANVQINATANRYFEPASGSFIFGGINVRVSK
jgi:iron complex outermembrane receptor protein